MNTYFFARLRGPIIITVLILLIGGCIGATWGWVTALAFVIGSGFFTLCCFLTYYGRASFHFNNILDPNQSAHVAFFTNRLVEAKRHRAGQEETLPPFAFKPERDAQTEERIVRSILRQVFGDE